MIDYQKDNIYLMFQNPIIKSN